MVEEDQGLLAIIRETADSALNYIEVSGAGEILRRYFVMNAFDGALTMLGFVMGVFTTGVNDPHVVIGVGASTSLAMGISGFVGALITEKAEREKKVRELERSMFIDLSGTLIDRASKLAVILAAIVDAAAPAVAAMTSAIPFFLSIYGYLSFREAVYSSVGISLALIFLLGVYLGRTAGGKSLLYGLYMLTAGLLVSIIIGALGLGVGI